MLPKKFENILFQVEVTAHDRYIDFIITDESILFKSHINYPSYTTIHFKDIIGIKYVIETRMHYQYGRYTFRPFCHINNYDLFVKKNSGFYKINIVSAEAFIQVIDCLLNVLGKKFICEIATELLHSGKCIVDNFVFENICDNGMYAYNVVRQNFTGTKFYTWDDIEVVGNGEELAFFAISSKRKLYSLIIFERYNLIFLANAINAVRELKLQRISDLLKEL